MREFSSPRMSGLGFTWQTTAGDMTRSASTRSRSAIDAASGRRRAIGAAAERARLPGEQ